MQVVVHKLLEVIQDLSPWSVAVLALTLFVLCLVAMKISCHQRTREEQKEKRFLRFTRMLFIDSNDDRISKYAKIWGIDSSVENMDLRKLIEATEKLGFDKLQLTELHERIKEGERLEQMGLYLATSRQKEERRRVSRIVKACFNVARGIFQVVHAESVSILKTTNKMTGGFEDENNRA